MKKKVYLAIIIYDERMIYLYKAIYREFRPLTFDEIIGEDHITKTLKNQIFNKKTGHAYLFSGERGTGKTTSARVFARAINCLDLREGNPCNECINCKLSLNEETTDILEMDAASNRSITDIKNIKESLMYPPVQLKYKVYIIDEVHMLTTEAFNALLKSLEEPPEYLIFILATTEPEKLPDTILSRCQRFDFRKIPGPLLRENIINITNKLGREIEDGAVRLIVQNSGGSVRDSLSILDRLLGYSKGLISLEDGLEVLGNVDRTALINLIENIFSNDAKKVLLSIDSLINSGKDVLFLLKDISSLLRDLLMIKIVGKEAYPMIFLSEEEFKHLEEVSTRISQKRIRTSLNKMLEVENTLRWAAEPRILLEAVILSLMEEDKESEGNFSNEGEKHPEVEKPETRQVAEDSPSISKSEIKGAQSVMDKADKTINMSTRGERDSKKEIDQVIEENSMDVSISDEDWNLFLSKLSPMVKVLSSLLLPVAISGQRLLVDTTNINEEEIKVLKFEDNAQEIKSALKESFGQDLEIYFQKSEKKKKLSDREAIIEYFGVENVRLK